MGRLGVTHHGPVNSEGNPNDDLGGRQMEGWHRTGEVGEHDGLVDDNFCPHIDDHSVDDIRVGATLRDEPSKSDKGPGRGTPEAPNKSAE